MQIRLHFVVLAVVLGAVAVGQRHRNPRWAWLLKGGWAEAGGRWRGKGERSGTVLGGGAAAVEMRSRKSLAIKNLHKFFSPIFQAHTANQKIVKKN